MIKPWMSRSLELLQHAEGHLRAGSESDKVFAFISFDNAIETIIKTFRTRSGSQPAKRTQFPDEIDFLITYVTQELKQEVEHTKSEFVDLHEVRNQLYHRGTGFVPSERSLIQIRGAAIWVFKILYGVDPTPLMTTGLIHAQFVQQFYSFRAQLARTVEAIGLRQPTDVPTEPEHDWDLFVNRGEQLEMKYRYILGPSRLNDDRKVQKAISAWRGLTHPNSLEEDYLTVGEELGEVTDYLKDFLVSPDFLSELQPNDKLFPSLKAVWLEIVGGEVVLKIKPTDYDECWDQGRDMTISFVITDHPDLFASLEEMHEDVGMVTTPLKSASDNATWIPGSNYRDLIYEMSKLLFIM